MSLLDQYIFEPHLVSASQCLFVDKRDPFDIVFFLHDLTLVDSIPKPFSCHLTSGQTLLIDKLTIPPQELVEDLIGMPLEEYRGSDGYTHHRWQGLVSCDHQPRAHYLFPMYRKTCYTVGYCEYCSKAVYGEYDQKGRYVEPSRLVASR